MKKVLTLVFAVMIASMIGCSKSGPEKLKDLMSDMIKITEESTSKLESVKDDKEAAVILTKYAEEMKKLSEISKKIDADYPGLMVKESANLKAETEKFGKAMEKFVTATFSIMTKYPESKELQDAVKKFQGMK